MKRRVLLVALVVVALFLGGIAWTRYRNSGTHGLVGRYTLPGKEGWVDLTDANMLGLVSDGFGTVAHFKRLSESRLFVESATGLGSQVWIVEPNRDGLRVTLPGRPSFTADRVAARPEIRTAGLVGHWQNKEMGVQWTFSAYGTYTYAKPPLEEAGEFTLQGDTLHMVGYRPARPKHPQDYTRDVQFSLKGDTLELIWKGARPVRRQFQRMKS